MKTLAILLIAVLGLAYGRFLLDEKIPEVRVFSSLKDEIQDKRATLEVDSSVIDLYDEMLSSRNKYAILKINDENKVVIDSKGESGETTTEEEDEKEFNKMKDALPANEARYILYKFGFFSKQRKIRVDKVVFIIWSNSQAKNNEALQYKMESKKVLKELGITYSIKLSSKRMLNYMSFVRRVQWLV